MPDAIKVCVYGIPKPQPRPRAFRRGNHAAVYNPDTADAWKKGISAALAELEITKPIEHPVAVSMKFLMPRPKRLMRKADPDGEILHAGTPDADNLAKAVMDVCTGSIWIDDGQVADLFVQKRYAAKDAPSGMILIVMEM